MKPKIDKTKFGAITIDGKLFDHDVIIRLDGQVKKRKKKLSKVIYGISHTVSKDEAKHIYEKGAEQIIIGNGQNGLLMLSDEAVDYFKRKNCQIKLMPTPEAIQAWNKSKGKLIGMFHITC